MNDYVSDSENSESNDSERIEKIYMTPQLFCMRSNCSIDQLYILSKLDLSNQHSIKKIKKIEALEYLPKLLNLNLNFNSICKIQGLHQLQNLIELNLANNRIRSIQGLDNLQSLQVLNLNNNLIENIDQTICQLKSLKILRIARNELSRLTDVQYLSKLPLLSTLRIEENPLSNHNHSRMFIIYHLQLLKSLDGYEIMPEEKNQSLIVIPSLQDTNIKSSNQLEIGNNQSNISMSNVTNVVGISSDYQARLSNLTSRMISLEFEKEQLNEEVTRLKSVSNKQLLDDRLPGMHILYKKLEADLQTLQLEKEDIKKLLTSSEYKSKQLEVTLKSSQQNEFKLSQEVTNLKVLVEDKQRHIDSLYQHNDDNIFKKRVELLQKENQKLMDSNKQLENENKQLSLVNEDLKKSHVMISQEHESLRKECLDVRIHNRKLMVKLMNVNADFEAYVKAANSINLNRSSSKVELNNSNSVISSPIVEKSHIKSHTKYFDEPSEQEDLVSIIMNDEDEDDQTNQQDDIHRQEVKLFSKRPKDRIQITPMKLEALAASEMTTILLEEIKKGEMNISSKYKNENSIKSKKLKEACSRTISRLVKDETSLSILKDRSELANMIVEAQANVLYQQEKNILREERMHLENVIHEMNEEICLLVKSIERKSKMNEDLDISYHNLQESYKQIEANCQIQTTKTSKLLEEIDSLENQKSELIQSIVMKEEEHVKVIRNNDEEYELLKASKEQLGLVYEEIEASKHALKASKRLEFEEHEQHEELKAKISSELVMLQQEIQDMHLEYKHLLKNKEDEEQRVKESLILKTSLNEDIRHLEDKLVDMRQWYEDSCLKFDNTNYKLHKLRKNLTNEELELEKAMDKMKQDNKKHIKQNNKLIIETRNLENVINKLKLDKCSLESQVQDLRNSLRLLDSQISHKYQSFDENMLQIDEKLNSSKQHWNQLTSEIELQMMIINDNKQKIEMYSSKYQNLQIELISLEKKYHLKLIEVNKCDEVIESYKLAIESFQDEANRQNDEIQRVKCSLDNLKQIETQMKLSIQTISNNEKTIQDNIQYLQVQVKESKLKLESYDEQYKELCSLSNQESHQLNKIQRDIVSYETSLLDLKRQKATLEESIVMLHKKEEQLHELQSRVSSLEMLINEYTNKKSQYERVLVEYEEKMKETSKIVLKKEDELEKLLNTIHSNEDHILQYQKEHKELESIISSLCYNIDKIENYYAFLLEESQSLEKANMQSLQIERDFAELRREYSLLESRYHEIQQLSDEEKQRLSESRKQLHENVNELDHIDKLIQQKRQQFMEDKVHADAEMKDLEVKKEMYHQHLFRVSTAAIMSGSDITDNSNDLKQSNEVKLNEQNVDGSSVINANKSNANICTLKVEIEKLRKASENVLFRFQKSSK